MYSLPQCIEIKILKILKTLKIIAKDEKTKDQYTFDKINFLNRFSDFL